MKRLISSTLELDYIRQTSRFQIFQIPQVNKIICTGLIQRTRIYSSFRPVRSVLDSEVQRKFLHSWSWAIQMGAYEYTQDRIHIHKNSTSVYCNLSPCQTFPHPVITYISTEAPTPHDNYKSIKLITTNQLVYSQVFIAHLVVIQCYKKNVHVFTLYEPLSTNLSGVKVLRSPLRKSVCLWTLGSDWHNGCQEKVVNTHSNLYLHLHAFEAFK